MLSPLLFFTLSANLIWTYVLPGLPGLAYAGRRYGLEKPKKNIGVLAMFVPVVFLGIGGFLQCSETDFYRSQKRLVDAYRSLAAADEQLNLFKGKTLLFRAILSARQGSRIIWRRSALKELGKCRS